jgi:hypothetical protein
VHSSALAFGIAAGASVLAAAAAYFLVPAATEVDGLCSKEA